MAQKLTLRYDRIGDILYVETCLPYATQESDCLADEIVGRYNPDTGELEGMEILFFSRRFPRGGRASRVVGMRLPFDVTPGCGRSGRWAWEQLSRASSPAGTSDSTPAASAACSWPP